MNLLFVYGSLRANGPAHHLLGGAAAEAPGRLSASELVNHGDYPMLQPGIGSVDGEVYRVSNALWPLLDAWEEAPQVYERVQRQLDDGRWVWVYQRPG
ncbi:gamma-glutamylcyclotransferase [Synechococcus sp. BS56D]|nr:gamma-glutamylcyclotransferase [Synechococcus sp. BS56D]